MDNIKAIFLDSEGTLRDDKHFIKPEIIQIIDELTKKGIYIIITTGLPRFIVRKIQNQAHASNLIIASNGADVYDIFTKQNVYACTLDTELVKTLWQEYRENYNIILGMGDIEYATCASEYNKNPVIIDEKNIHNNFFQCHISQKPIMPGDNLLKEAEKAQKKYVELTKYLEQELLHKLCSRIDSLTDDELVRVIRASRFIELAKVQKAIIDNYADTTAIANQCADFTTYNHLGERPWFTLNNVNVSKGNGINKLCEYLEIPLEERLAIGNDYNDRTMFNAVGKMMCPSSSCTCILEKSDYIYDEKEGIDKVLKKIL